MRALLIVVALMLAAPALAADGEPKKALTKAGQATARSIVLKRGDLGAGFVAQRRPSDEALPKGARCGALDESDLTVVGDADSPDFRLAAGAAFVSVGSTAQVYRSVGDAEASWRRGTSSQTATCLADIARLSAAPGQKITILSSKRIRFPLVAPKTSAYRIVLTVAIGAQRVRAYVDAIIVQEGRIQSALLLTSVGRPVAHAESAALARVIAGRIARQADAGGPVA